MTAMWTASFLCRPVKKELQGPVIRLAPERKSGRPQPAGVGDRVLAKLIPDEEGGYEAQV